MLRSEYFVSRNAEGFGLPVRSLLISNIFLLDQSSLSLRAYGGAARMSRGGAGFSPLHHMIIFVQPISESNVTYLADVGFGGSNLGQPILLSDSNDNVVWGSCPPERHRLTLGVNPESTLAIGECSIIPNYRNL